MYVCVWRMCEDHKTIWRIAGAEHSRTMTANLVSGGEASSGGGIASRARPLSGQHPRQQQQQQYSSATAIFSLGVCVFDMCTVVCTVVHFVFSFGAQVRFAQVEKIR